VSTDHGLEQDFNSLDAQHDAAQAYIRSQAHAGWALIRSRYDDGGYSGTPHLGNDPAFTEVGHQPVEAAKLEIAAEDGANTLGLLFNHADLALLGLGRSGANAWITS
jgi:hypothetical protein